MPLKCWAFEQLSLIPATVLYTSVFYVLSNNEFELSNHPSFFVHISKGLYICEHANGPLVKVCYLLKVIKVAMDNLIYGTLNI